MKTSKGYIRRYFLLIYKTARRGILLSLLVVSIATVINLWLPQITQKIIDDGIMQQDKYALLIFCLQYVGFFVVVNFLEFFKESFFYNLNLKTSMKMKNMLLEKIPKSNGQSLSKLNTGDYLYMLDNDVYQVECFGVDTFFDLAVNVITAIIALTIMIKLNIILAVIISLIQVFTILIQAKLSNKIAKMIQRVRDLAGDQSNIQEQYISNMKNVVLTNFITFFQNKISNVQQEFVIWSKKANSNIILHSKFIGIFSSIGLILTYFVGGNLIIIDEMSIGELFAFISYTTLFTSPLVFLSGLNLKFKQLMISIKKIFSELDRIETTEDTGLLLASQKITSIQFEDITFSYGERQIFDRLSLHFVPNKIVLLTGQSGCGKSTLIQLLYRLWESEKGRILINGIDIRKYTLESIRNRICIVTQEAFIFNGSILDNIFMNMLNINEKKAMDIIHRVGLTDLIYEKNCIDGDMDIGERGSNISGGQKQRIAICRALMQQSDVLIFDESFSALDNHAQQNILLNIRPYLEEKIVIFVTHRALVNVGPTRLNIFLNNGKAEIEEVRWWLA